MLNDWLIGLGYGLCAVSYLTLLVISRLTNGSHLGRLFGAAIAIEAIWSASYVIPVVTGWRPALWFVIVEWCRALIWAFFVYRLLAQLQESVRGEISDQSVSTRVPQIAKLLLAFIAVSVLAAFLGPSLRAWIILQIAVAIAVLVLVEQLWRNAGLHHHWAMKFFIFGLLIKFGFDVAMYANGYLFSGVQTNWIVARSVVNGLVVPLLAISAARNRGWSLDIGVSRDLVFHSATLTFSGLMLSAIALGGYYVSLMGGTLAGAMAIIITVAGVLAMLILMSSGYVRQKIRVLIAKNFFSYRYDYRKEWIQLARTMSQGSRSGANVTGDTLEYRALRVLGNFIASQSGALWLTNDGKNFQCRVTIGRSLGPDMSHSDELIHWMRIEKRILKSDSIIPDSANGRLLELIRENNGPAVIIPLVQESELLGFALLEALDASQPIDWEELAILKVASEQVASYLAVSQATNALAQAKQFESFNRRSAYIAHDLKNLVSEMGLVLRNADRHKNDPNFHRDVIETVRETFEQMQRLLQQLNQDRQGDTQRDQGRERTPISSVLQAAYNRKVTNNTGASIDLDPSLNQKVVLANHERLVRVFGHLIQNALEATDASRTDRVTIKGWSEGSHAIIDIVDNGVGMTRSFIQDHLFTPFSSAKNGGMGIGMFECREYIKEIGGSMRVNSQPNIGTRISVRLPAGET